MTDQSATVPTAPDSAGPEAALSGAPRLASAEPESLPLPGLDDTSGRGRPVADLEAAVRRTLAELHAWGSIKEVDAGRTALAIELAQVITDKRASKRTSTLGNDARVLMEILDSLAPAAASDADVGLRGAMEAWAAEVAAMEAKGGTGAAAADAAAEVRDPA